MSARILTAVSVGVLAAGLIAPPAQAVVAHTSDAGMRTTAVKPGVACKKAQVNKRSSTSTYGTLVCRKRGATYRWLGVGGNPVGSPAALAQSAAADQWVGTWDSNFGEMSLARIEVQAENGVVYRLAGSYGFDNGRIAGTPTGAVLNGRWGEAPTYRGPNDAGKVTFTLTADGKTWAGTFTYDGGGGGGWHATRM